MCYRAGGKLGFKGVYMFEIKTEIKDLENPLGFYKIPESVYFKRPEVSKSDLDHLRRSPKAYKYNKDVGIKFDSPSLLLGKVVHSLYLEPESFNDDFVIKPTIDRRTKIGKSMWADFEAANSDKTIIDQEVFDKANGLVFRVERELGKISEVCPAKGHPEVSAFFRLNEVACRGRFDYLGEDHIIYDLKTTSSLETFEKSVANFGYHRQLAFYGLGLASLTKKFKGFKFIVIETNEPYDSAILELDMSAMRVGKTEILELLERLKVCRKDNSWPGIYPHEEKNVISLPRWYS